MKGRDDARPAISVLIAAYNAESTLPEQLEALSTQSTTFAWELLVCDNGSTDRTAAVVSAWSARLPGLRLVDASARRGPGAARNSGAAVATSPLLAFCDADDRVDDAWLAEMHAALQRSVLVAGELEGVSLNTANRASVTWAVSADIRKRFWPRFPAGASSNLAIHRDVFLGIGGFDEDLRTGEDVDLCWRVQLAGHALARNRRAVVHSRQRDGLRAVYRQAFSYGQGDRQLQHKYARLIAENGSDLVPAVVLDQPGAGRRSDAASEPAAHSRSALRRLLRLGTPRGLANLAWRTGEWCGSHLGRVDRTAPQLPPRASPAVRST